MNEYIYKVVEGYPYERPTIERVKIVTRGPKVIVVEPGHASGYRTHLSGKHTFTEDDAVAEWRAYAAERIKTLRAEAATLQKQLDGPRPKRGWK